MKLPKKLNAMVVESLETRLSDVKDCLLIDYAGLDGFQTFELRGRLRKTRCRMKVVKNAVAKVAFDRVGLGSLSGHLKGGSALIYGEGEALLSIAKVVTEWNKDKVRKPLSVKGGLMAGALINAGDLARLAAIPSKQELLAKVAGGVRAPLFQLVGALAGVQRKLVYAVKAVADQRAKAGEATAA